MNRRASRNDRDALADAAEGRKPKATPGSVKVVELRPRKQSVSPMIGAALARNLAAMFRENPGLLGSALRRLSMPIGYVRRALQENDAEFFQSLTIKDLARIAQNLGVPPTVLLSDARVEKSKSRIPPHKRSRK